MKVQFRTVDRNLANHLSRILGSGEIARVGFATPAGWRVVQGTVVAWQPVTRPRPLEPTWEITMEADDVPPREGD